MLKQTQKNRIINKLLKDGFITRNECLRNYISRLGAIISFLQDEGWKFEAFYDKNDYKYKLLFCPLKKSVYTIDGKQIVTYNINN
jgi:hypothetical protein